MLPLRSHSDEHDHPSPKRRRPPNRQRHHPTPQERAQRSLLKHSGRQSRRDRKWDAAEALESYLTTHPCDAHDARYASEAILEAQVEIVEGAYWCWIEEEWANSREMTLKKKKRKGNGKARKGKDLVGKAKNGKKTSNADVKHGGTTSQKARKASNLENPSGASETQPTSGNCTEVKDESGRTKKKNKAKETTLRHGKFLVTFVERTPEERAVERALLEEKRRLRYERPVPTVWDLVAECLISAGARA